MVSCAAYGCTNRTDRKIPGVSFHKLPRHEEKRKLWMKAIRRKNWHPGPRTCICSQHFREEDFDRMSLCYVRLREDAVPSIFPAFPKHLQQTLKKRRTVTSIKSILGSTSDVQRSSFPDTKSKTDSEIFSNNAAEYPGRLRSHCEDVKSGCESDNMSENIPHALVLVCSFCNLALAECSCLNDCESSPSFHGKSKDTLMTLCTGGKDHGRWPHQQTVAV